MLDLPSSFFVGTLPFWPGSRPLSPSPSIACLSSCAYLQDAAVSTDPAADSGGDLGEHLGTDDPSPDGQLSTTHGLLLLRPLGLRAA